MRNKNNKHLGIEIEPELHQKLRYTAKFDGRSINGQVIYLIKQYIRDFEKREGDIPAVVQEPIELDTNASL